MLHQGKSVPIIQKLGQDGPGRHACTARKPHNNALCETEHEGQVDPHRPACVRTRAVVEVGVGDRPAVRKAGCRRQYRCQASQADTTDSV